MLVTNCLIKLILAVLAGVFLLTTGSRTGSPLYIVAGAGFLVWAYFIYTDENCYVRCDPSLWSSQALVTPSDFSADQESTTVCKAQKWAQDNSYEAFIACLRDDDSGLYDVMYLKNKNSFSGTETACTDCQIYYTKNFKVSLGQETGDTRNAACPMNPYPYCTADDIEAVYVNLNCSASTSLVKKLISEGKLDGNDDPRIVKCCETPELCRARGVKAFPTVACKNDVLIQGFCP